MERKHGLDGTRDQIAKLPEAFRERVRTFIRSLPSHYVADGGKRVIAHAGIALSMMRSCIASIRSDRPAPRLTRGLAASMSPAAPRPTSSAGDWSRLGCGARAAVRVIGQPPRPRPTTRVLARRPPGQRRRAQGHPQLRRAVLPRDPASADRSPTRVHRRPLRRGDGAGRQGRQRDTRTRKVDTQCPNVGLASSETLYGSRAKGSRAPPHSDPRCHSSWTRPARGPAGGPRRPSAASAKDEPESSSTWTRTHTSS